MKLLIIFIFLTILIGSCDNSNFKSSENRNPVINKLTATPEVIYIGEVSTLKVDATDPDGDELKYNWSANLGELRGSGSEVYFSALNCCIGRNPVEVTVEDGKGGKATELIYIIVKE